MQLTPEELAVIQRTGVSPDAFALVKQGDTQPPLTADERQKMARLLSLDEAMLSADIAEHVAFAACSFAIDAAPSSDAVELQLTPDGYFTPSDGRSFVPGRWHIDQTVASKVIERFSQLKNDRVLDYEHQTMHKETNGQPAPAAGWISGLRWRDGVGLFGVASLTSQARADIAAGRYRYVSPVFAFDSRTGNVLDIRMAALTNAPALDGMRSVVL